MDARETARMNGIGRIVLGSGLMLAPGLMGRTWVGSDATSTGAKVLCSALGARDVALGLGAVLALENEGPVRGWMEGAALADAADFVATLAAGSGIPRVSRLAILAVAAGSAVQCVVASRSVD